MPCCRVGSNHTLSTVIYARLIIKYSNLIFLDDVIWSGFFIVKYFHVILIRYTNSQNKYVYSLHLTNWIYQVTPVHINCVPINYCQKILRLWAAAPPRSRRTELAAVQMKILKKSCFAWQFVDQWNSISLKRQGPSRD